MGQRIVTISVLLLSLLAGFYQVYVKPALQVAGYGRTIEPIGNEDCRAVRGLEACEKIVLHQTTGVLYLACSTTSSRLHWVPAGGHLNTTGKSDTDYVATYDPQTGMITRLIVANYNDRGLSLHGMDVVASTNDPDQVFIYLVNHRTPLHGDPQVIGADSSIEIFKAFVGGHEMVHVQTVDSPNIITPNDVVGSSDGKSFYFTNDHGSKMAFARMIKEYLSPGSSVGYCHTEHGCKIVAPRLPSCNGIVRAKNDTIYVANSLHTQLHIYDRQADNSLVLSDIVYTDRGMDNLSIDYDGMVWALGFPKLLAMVYHMDDPLLPSPSSALRFSLNVGRDSFYGKKYRVDKVFEDDGTIASGSTTVVHDSQRGRLFFHGIAAPWLTVCNFR
ncbi:serum paraoxonase/arylesterase [Infundibulicybe gibba]|nr:serum paraoxonase/arylesterase [Infundibulicybe gibba]